MAFTSYPFDLGPGAGIQTAAQWRAMARRWRNTGVNKGDRNGLLVASESGLQTTVASGSAFVLGEYADNDASVTKAHAAAHATFGRLDLVVLELNLTDLNAPKIDAVVVAGTPSGSPVLPTLTQNSTIYQIPLASVLIPALATAVSTITDYRPWAGHRSRMIDGAAGGTATTTSTTYVDMTTMDSGQFYSDGGDISIRFSGTVWNSGAGNTIQIGVAIDAGSEAFLGQAQSGVANQLVPFSAGHLFTGVAAGWHRIKMRWQASAGTNSCNNSRRLTWVEET